MENLINQLTKNFPITSQTSTNDKLFLLQTMNLIKSKVGRFSYLEIGSFLGGSLTPFLLEPLCEDVLSVDDRERQQPDERGIKYDYAGITHITMIQNLSKHGVPIEKLTTHDGSIDTIPNKLNKYDLIFIDGEHTDVACFRDFIWSYKSAKEDSIILFHDSDLTYKGLTIIKEYLRSLGVKNQMKKINSSVVTGIYLGEFSQIEFESIYGAQQEWDDFYEKSEIKVLKDIITNRMSINFTTNILPIKNQKAY